MNRVLAGRARVAVRMSVPLAALGLSAVALSSHLSGLPRIDLAESALSLPLPRLALALLLVAVAFAAVAGQERAVMAHLAIAVPARQARAAAAATAAVSQMVGFGPVVGAIVRRRLLPGLSLAQSFGISVGITAGFFAGLALLWLGLAAALAGGSAGRAALAGLATAVAACLFAMLLQRSLGWGLRLPNAAVAARFLGWLAVDLLALGTAFWLVIPHGPVPLAEALAVFLPALGAGMLSGSPAGAGLFETAVVMQLPQLAPDSIVTGLVLFRLVAFALPAMCGAAYACLAPLRADPGRGTHAAAPPLGATGIAEAGLVHQGELAVIHPAPGVAWLSGALPHSRVALGDPVAPCAAIALQALRGLAGREGRFTCVYKCSPRIAAAARHLGFRTLPVAREAVLDPVGFTLSGARRAGLRRKLNHARKAGVAVTAAAVPPLAEMAEVAAEWRRRHGRERGFSMGRWNPAAVRQQAVFVARDTEGEMVAFITFHTAAALWTLDLIRCRDGLPDGTIHALVVAALDAARAQGIDRLSLAAVPEAMFAPRRLWTAAVRRRAGGLMQFKAAFAPRWERRYIAAPSRAALAVCAAEIALAVHVPPPVSAAEASTRRRPRLPGAKPFLEKDVSARA